MAKKNKFDEISEDTPKKTYNKDEVRKKKPKHKKMEPYNRRKI